MSPHESGSDLFRQEAIDHHLRDPESFGVIDARLRWTWPVIFVSLVLAAATAFYALLMHTEVVHALQERLLR